MDTAKRTVLYRVAQEALTNVARHAQSQPGGVSIQKVRRTHLHENQGRRQILSSGTR
jgi:signal transduction histidine kinase